MQILLVIFISCCFEVMAQESSYIRPGTPEWSKLKTHDEMLAACQIPEDQLLSLSTADLIDTCIYYPMLLDMLAHENLVKGFEIMSRGFNGFQELMKRPDLNEFILDKYKAMQIKAIQNEKDLASQGFYSFRITAIELILSEAEILKSFSLEEKKQLLKEAISKSEDIGKFYEKTSIGRLTNVFLIANISDNLESESWILNADNDYKSFIETMYISNSELLDEIIKNAKELIKL